MPHLTAREAGKCSSCLPGGRGSCFNEDMLVSARESKWVEGSEAFRAKVTGMCNAVYALLFVMLSLLLLLLLISAYLERSSLTTPAKRPLHFPSTLCLTTRISYLLTVFPVYYPSPVSKQNRSPTRAGALDISYDQGPAQEISTEGIQGEEWAEPFTQKPLFLRIAPSVRFRWVLSLLEPPWCRLSLLPGLTSSLYFPGALSPQGTHPAPASRLLVLFLWKPPPKYFIPAHTPHPFFEEQGLFWYKCN